MKYLNPTLLILLLSIGVTAQSSNLLQNGSFENQQEGHSRIPTDWINCGFPGESPPDIFSFKRANEFRVNHEPCEGDLYLHMVARDNDTYEQIGQRVSLSKGKVYRLTVAVSKAPTTLSRSRTTNELTNYDTPIYLRFSGGSEICHGTEVIHQTELVFSEDWVAIDVTFEAKSDMNYFLISASPGDQGSVNGNVLVDNVKLVEISGTK